MLSKFFLKFVIVLLIITFIPKNSNASIYELSCKNNKNTTTWVYSNKRKQVILTNVNNSKTKKNFQMERQTPSSFSSKDSKYRENFHLWFSRSAFEAGLPGYSSKC